MKKTILLIATVLLLASCTKNYRTRNLGGSETVYLDPGYILVNATWKDSNLWYLTEKAPNGHVPRTIYFKEKSTYGAMEGTVVFIER